MNYKTKINLFPYKTLNLQMWVLVVVMFSNTAVLGLNVEG